MCSRYINTKSELYANFEDNSFAKKAGHINLPIYNLSNPVPKCQ